MRFARLGQLFLVLMLDQSGQRQEDDYFVLTPWTWCSPDVVRLMFGSEMDDGAPRTGRHRRSVAILR